MSPLLLPLLLAASLLPATNESQPTERVPIDAGPVRAAPLTPESLAAHAAGGPRRLTVKFVDAARARASERGDLRSLNGAALDGARRLAAEHDLRFAPLLRLPASTLAELERRAADRSGRRQPDLGGMLIVEAPTKDVARLEALGEALRALPEVEYAYLQTLGAPPPGDLFPPTPNLTANQTYVPPDPGLDAAYAHGMGFDGSGIRYSDCEYGWNPDHEDLNDISLNLEPGQTLDPGVIANGWDSHGTAVVGSSHAVQNAYGITGISHQSSVYTFPEWTVEEGFRRATCIANAIAGSAAGDVVLLEMQTGGAGGGFGPAELDPNVFTIVKAGTDAGVIVVAAAGNGNQNLDAAAYGPYREMGDSGAILIGAGSSNTGHNKLSFSTYGSRVNVQAWGEDVFTLGYGNFAAYGGEKNQRYTDTFNGTSSASGLSAPSVCVVQEAAVSITGRRLSPIEMRDLLEATGRPQGTGGNIGPCIDLRAAIEALQPAASAMIRNGTGVNPEVYLSVNTPVLGTTWRAEVLTEGHAGASHTLILGTSQPLAGTPSGFGEQLIDLGSVPLFRSRRPVAGALSLHAIPVPNEASLLGARAYTQAAILGGTPVLTNALDLTIGI